MWITFLLRGVIIGMLASIPMGPIGVLCIQRTLSKNQRSGFASGLGAAVTDTFYSALAFFSLSFILAFIKDNITVIKVLGGLCVMLVGAKIFFTNPVVQIRRNRAGKSNLWQDFISVLFITLANPALILIFVALFAAFGISNDSLGFVNGSFMIAGVLIGASLWWFTLTFVVNLFRKNFRPRHLLWMNRISGGIIILLGAITVLLMFVNTPMDDILQ